MQRTSWVVFGFAVIVLAGAAVWPTIAQPTGDPKYQDRLAQIEKRLDGIERILFQIQSHSKDGPKSGWQRIEGLGDKDPYIILFQTETGKVKFIDMKAAAVYDK